MKNRSLLIAQAVISLVLFATPTLAYLDVCADLSYTNNGVTIQNRKHLPNGATSTDAIMKFVEDEFHDLQNSTFSHLIIEIPAGKYSGVNGILINDKLIGSKGLCLVGLGRPTITRTRFSNETNEPAVIKIYSVGNIVVRGFEITGTISPDNSNVGPSGVTIVNFDHPAGISNITIEDNIVHTIGQDNQYENMNGFWKYKGDKDVACTQIKQPQIGRVKVSCGQAHGINVASNTNPVSKVFFIGNVLSNLRLGKSEAITIGENVEGFEVSGNTISDVDNIAIDIAGMQDREHQTKVGIVKDNIIKDLKGSAELGGQNSAYPYVAGIYIDGGTGLSWDKSIKISNNTVTKFGIGIAVGSENNYCDNNPGKCSHVRVQFVEIIGNILKDNFLYGIGVGKENKDQKSQTWNIRIAGNTLIGNNTDVQQAGYSELHFGSVVKKDGLKNITVTCNYIAATVANTYLARVVPEKSQPDVTFEKNTFYKVVQSRLWAWANKTNFTKDDLFDKITNISRFSEDPNGNSKIKGKNNYWDSSAKPCS